MLRLNWCEYFSNIAREIATRSEDPSTQVGCIIVNKDKQIVSTGYNGFVAGCNNNGKSYDRPMKYHLILHAEMNAIIFAEQDIKDCILYCTHAPCDRCLTLILQAGIKDIIFDKSDLCKRFSLDMLRACLNLCICKDTINIRNTVGISYSEILLKALEERAKEKMNI